MPLYFFDFRQGSDRCTDAEGSEFADVEQAYLETFRAAQDMWGELLHKRQDPRRCSFEVRSEGGELLFILPLQEVVDSCSDRIGPPIHTTFERD